MRARGRERGEQLTSLLQQDEHQAGEHLEYLGHHHSRGGEEAVARQRAHIADAENERGVLDHQH